MNEISLKLAAFLRELAPLGIMFAKQSVPGFEPADKVIYLIFPNRDAYRTCLDSFVPGKLEMPDIRIKSTDYAQFDFGAADDKLRQMVLASACLAGGFVVFVAIPVGEGFSLEGGIQVGPRK